MSWVESLHQHGEAHPDHPLASNFIEPLQSLQEEIRSLMARWTAAGVKAGVEARVEARVGWIKT